MHLFLFCTIHYVEDEEDRRTLDSSWGRIPLQPVWDLEQVILSQSLTENF